MVATFVDKKVVDSLDDVVLACTYSAKADLTSAVEWFGPDGNTISSAMVSSNYFSSAFVCFKLFFFHYGLEDLCGTIVLQQL